MRQAVAYAIPYQKIMDAVLFGLAKPMFGARPTGADGGGWPQPHPINTDIAKAKQLMAEAGYPNGFETHALVRSRLCRRQRAALRARAGKPRADRHPHDDQQDPGPNWRTELNKKEMPLFTNVFSGWLDYPEYFFFWCYHGQNSVFNTMSYKNPKMDALIDGARQAAATGDKAAYEKDVKGFVDLAFADIPRIPLFQPYVNVAMQKNVSRLPILVPSPARLSRAREGLKARGRRRRRSCAMRSIVLKRLATAIPSLIGVIVVSFLLTRVLPGDTGGLFRRTGRDAAGDRGGAEASSASTRALPEQFARYVVDLAHGDLGQFADDRPAGGDGDRQPPACLRRTDAARSDLSRWRSRCRSAFWRRFGEGSWIDHLCRVIVDGGRVAAGFLHRTAARLRLLFPARLVAGAARAGSTSSIARRRTSPAST